MRSAEETLSAKVISASLAGSVLLGGEMSVHRVGFGAMRLTGEGIWGQPKNRTDAIKVLRRAAELGVNFIDTADSYGPRVSEELIAEALFPYPSGLVVATKGGWNRPGPNQWTHDATSSHLRQAVEGSLKRLRLERIELYQLHTPDPVVPFEDSVGTLAELKNEGMDTLSSFLRGTLRILRPCSARLRASRGRDPFGRGGRLCRGEHKNEGQEEGPHLLSKRNSLRGIT